MKVVGGRKLADYRDCEGLSFLVFTYRNYSRKEPTVSLTVTVRFGAGSVLPGPVCGLRPPCCLSGVVTVVALSAVKGVDTVRVSVDSGSGLIVVVLYHAVGQMIVIVLCLVDLLLIFAVVSERVALGVTVCRLLSVVLAPL